MSTVKATRVTVVLDEKWMEVFANHHSVVESGEVFVWESSEPLDYEVEDEEDEPDIPVSIVIDTVDLDPEADWRIEASFSVHRPSIRLDYTAVVEVPRDASPFIEVSHRGDLIDNFDEALGREVMQTILDAVDLEHRVVRDALKRAETSLSGRTLVTTVEAVR